MKQSREKMLLFAFVGVLALWQGQSLFRMLVLDPVQSREDRRTALGKKVDNLKIDLREIEAAKGKLKAWENRSLPPVPVQAQSAYQPWLIELATQSKLTGVSVEILSGNPLIKGGTYYSIAATVKARGTLDRVCDFLHAFHQAGLLHRVTSLSIESAKHDGNPPLDVTIGVEGLALVNSPARTTLFADPSAAPKPGQPLKDRKEYDSIVGKNLFVSTFKAQKPADDRKKTPVENLPDTAEFVYLVASVARGAERDATLFDRTSAKETKLTPGIDFNIAGLSGKVVSINDDHIVVEYLGEQWQLDLGKNLRQMRKP